MTLSYDLFWSFRSPYSYLVTKRLVALERDYDVKAVVRPVYPIAVRIPGFFKQVNPMWPPYLMKDTRRIAEMEGLPYAWPSPDPILMDMKSGEVATEQPYISRLTRAGVLAAERGLGLAFLDEISSVIFGGVKNWHEGDHLQNAAKRAGLDMDELDETAAKEADRLEAVIAANEASQKAAGHWGVPLMAFEGEPFFGQDRVDHLVWRMKQQGLRKRG
ncbi:2-hydroxychromene-2-carboxylate isomerase [Parvibaculum sp.]|uniref:2-hydroxychromene-2-carboxylate isomerase n=1 Tax=Parvibaculum sp. TaxID=2024848 RepID=UPI00391D6638